ncbi:serine hydrolase domain-containing protein [Aquimarina addita]|uniref:Serine hydrolase domain-containing protein n=1 Tax=Aquimarina addita TaxID=870485 RepID=A0ABP6UV33_9FLAO
MKSLIILFLFANTLCFSQQENFKQLNTLFDVLEVNNKAMGSVAIMKEGKLVYSKSIGFQYKTNKEKKPTSHVSKYRIGSITKVITASMIFQLIDEKKIHLEDKLALYFPEIPNAKKITITNLLTHSSGLFNITEDTNFSTWMLKPSTQEQMLARIKSHEVIFEPGDQNEYSNTNFILLGYILEKIEEKPYKMVLKERIADKLHLTNTYYGSVIKTNKNECQSYYYDKNELTPAVETHMSNPGGAGGVVSSATDLTTFMNALFTEKIMSSTSFEQMTKPSDSGTCSGIFSLERNGQTIFGHGGSIDGFTSFAMYIPEIKTAIAITLNASEYGTQPIAFHMHDVINGKNITIPNFDKIELTAAQLKAYEGVYESASLPFDLTFKASGNILKGGPDSKHLRTLVANKKDEFALEAMGIILKFDVQNNTVLFNDQTSEPTLLTKKQ